MTMGWECGSTGKNYLQRKISVKAFSYFCKRTTFFEERNKVLFCFLDDTGFTTLNNGLSHAQFVTVNGLNTWQTACTVYICVCIPIINGRILVTWNENQEYLDWAGI